MCIIALCEAVKSWGLLFGAKLVVVWLVLVILGLVASILVHGSHVDCSRYAAQIGMCCGTVESVCLVCQCCTLVSGHEMSRVAKAVSGESAIPVLVELVPLESVSCEPLLPELVAWVLSAIFLVDFIDLCLECVFLLVI